MARTAVISTNFTAGELSQRMKGRVDINKYFNGVAVMENFVPMVQGGATRRPAQRYVNEVKDSTKKHRLIPFVFSRSQAYQLEFGENTMRVYKDAGTALETAQNITNVTQANPGVLTYAGADPANGDVMYLSGIGGMTRLNGRYVKVTNVNAGANTFDLVGLGGTGINTAAYAAYTAGGTMARVYSISTPWTAAEVFDLKFSQVADTMYLSHPNHDTYQLVRNGHTDWKLSVVPWLVRPSDEQGIKPAATLTPSATTGTGINFTASVASFLASDVGRELVSGHGVASITGFTSTTVVVCTIIDDFASTSAIASQSWTLTLSPVTSCTPSAAGLGASITLTLAADGWRAGDVGSYVRINDGTVEITGYTSATVVNGTVRSELTNTTAASAGAWTLEQAVWNSTNGYPRANTIFEQRLYLSGSAQYPQTIWGSKAGEFLNHALGANDSDAVSFTIATNEVNQIEHLASISDLIPLTYGGEFRLYGGGDTTITPTNARIKSQSGWGCSTVRPARVGNDVLFVSRSGKKVRSLAYNFGTDTYHSLNTTLLSEHITGSGLTDMAYQQDPDSRIWTVRSDGQFPSCTFDKEQEVMGWCRSVTDGVVESVSVIPYGSSDQVWMIVKRTIGGVTRRYVEYLDDTLNTDACVYGSVGSSAVIGVTWAAGVLTVNQAGHGYSTGDRVKLEGFVPAAINVSRTITKIDANNYSMTLADDPGAATTVGTARQGSVTWYGLDHLEGKTVNVVADQSRLTDKVVSGGAITIDRPGFDVEIGLPYVSTLTLLPVESQAYGTQQGRMTSVYEIIVRLLNTRGLQIDGKEVEFFQHGADVLDNPAPTFTGDKVLEKIQWERSGGAITITQPYPLPCTILSVVRKVNLEQ